MRDDEYELIRSKRKSLSIEIRADGRIIVRVPMRIQLEEVREFVNSKESWIRTHQKIARERAEALKADERSRLSREEIRELAEKALLVIPDRVAYYAEKMGVTYGSITIRNQRTRWGSCSAKGNLNFNCLLMLAPPEVLDGVVVHELCHRIEMNHSKKFYEEVLRVYPEYRKSEKWLKENGRALLRRMTG